MKSTSSDLGKRAITFLGKKELQNVYGGGKFVWDTTTKTLYYVRD